MSLLLYRDNLIQFLDKTYSKLFTAHDIEFKNVFGAVGGYVDGNIFISCGKFGFALKLPYEKV